MDDIKNLNEQELVYEINKLAKKENLSQEELVLQKILRNEYISRIKKNLKSHLDNIKPQNTWLKNKEVDD